MADPSQLNEEATLNNHPQISLINTFCEITTCALKSEALFFLESHNFDLDAAVSTYLDDFTAGAAEPSAASPVSPLASEESLSPARSRSPSPPPPRASQAYNLRSSAARPNARGRGGIRTFSDLNQNDKDEDDADSDPDFDPQEHHTGSGALVQDPSKENDVDAIFDRARQLGGVTEHHSPSSSRSFSGTARLLSGEVSSTTQPPEDVIHNIVFWSNGFTVDDGPLRRLDDPENAPFLESIKRGVCPDELHPADKRTAAYVNLIRKEENYQEPKKKRIPFRGSGRTLGSTSDVTTEQSITFPLTSVTAAPTSSLRLVVDETKPTTSIQLRLADGTRLISRFNTNHTIRDIRGFIDASRPDGPRSYQLQSMGFPPKQLTDIDQTIDQAGVANSVVIQKL